MIKKSIFILVIFALIAAPVSAIINVTASDLGYNFIRWTWDPSANVKNASVDGINITSPDLNSGTFILSNIGPGELHQINLYSTSDTGTNLTRTENTGDVPVGLWVFAFFGVLFLVLARYSKVRFINMICPMFGLLGLYQLLGFKDIMDGSVWVICLLIYMILIVAGGAAYWYGKDGK